MSAAPVLPPDIRALALDYFHRGFKPLPIPLGGKNPYPAGWQSVTMNESLVRKHFDGRQYNIGLRLGESGLADADLDCAEAIAVGSLFLPETGWIFGRRSKPRSHWFYYSDPPQSTKQFKDPLRKDDKSAMLVELRCLKSDGGIGMQTVVPPSVHASNESIEFERGCTQIPANVEGDDLLKAISRLAATSLLARYFPPEGSRNAAFLALAGWLRRGGWTRDEILAVHRGIYRWCWGAKSDDGRCVAEVDQTLNKLANDHQATGFPKLKELLGENGDKILRTVSQWCDISRQANDSSLLGFLSNDLGNAERVKELYGDSLLYSVAEESWYEYDGTRWRKDSMLATQKRAKLTMLEFQRQAVESGKEEAAKFARSSMNQGAISAALASLRCELPVQISDFDQQRHLLNFRNGTVDLRTAAVRPHRRDDYITRKVDHDFNPGAHCPEFLRFLRQCMGAPLDASDDSEQAESDEMVLYLQRVFGYCLTAETKEKAIFIAWGEHGDNGKTTLLSLMREMVREYSTVVSLDLLTSKEENTNTLEARADLLGQRFVITSETEEGQRVTPAKLKRITQGQGAMIEACRKYESRIAFPETHKLWIDANFKPELPATDNAIWNRIHLIIFPQSVPKERQDPSLRGRLLEDEAEGILAWMVAGARQYYAEGLRKPSAVTAATTAWRDEMNRLKEFLEESTARLSKREGPSRRYVWNKDLYTRYLDWCEPRKYRPLSAKAFPAEMRNLGYVDEHGNAGTKWLDITTDLTYAEE